TASAQVIHACVKSSNGAVKIVADPAQCSANETPLEWGVQGPQGEPGADGAPGADGQPGEQGPPGPVLHVFDALGVDLGIFDGRPHELTNDPILYATRPAPNIPIPIHVNGNLSPLALPNGPFFTEAADAGCAGTPYVVTDAPNAPPIAQQVYYGTLGTGGEPLLL